MESLKQMTDEELRDALTKVAQPIIAELGTRGYEVKVTKFSVHTTETDEPAAAHRMALIKKGATKQSR